MRLKKKRGVSNVVPCSRQAMLHASEAAINPPRVLQASCGVSRSWVTGTKAQGVLAGMVGRKCKQAKLRCAAGAAHGVQILLQR